MSLRSAILGLLNKEPMNGYAIKTLFDEAINFIWQAELSQIYRELDAMEKEGLVTSSIEQQHDRPNKRVYSITESGRARFMEWLTAVPEQFLGPKRDEFMLQVLFRLHGRRGCHETVARADAPSCAQSQGSAPGADAHCGTPPRGCAHGPGGPRVQGGSLLRLHQEEGAHDSRDDNPLGGRMPCGIETRRELNMETTIYYYTATGNSLTFSRSLARELGNTTLVPIARYRQTPAAPATPRVGIIFPIHAWGPPRTVEEFIDKLDLRGVRYTFAIASCGGTAAQPFPGLRKTLRQKGGDLNAGFIVRSAGYMDLGGKQPPIIELVRRFSGRQFGKDSERLAEIVEAVRSEKPMRIERSALPGALLGSFFHTQGRAAVCQAGLGLPRLRGLSPAAAPARASARAAMSGWKAGSPRGTMTATTAAPAPRGARRMQSASRASPPPRAVTIPRWLPRTSCGERPPEAGTANGRQPPRATRKTCD